MFTTVAAFTDPIEAQLALGRLQAEGIPARLDDSGSAIMDWTWRLAIGGMRLRVPDAQAMHARRVLAALDAGEYALEADGAGPPDAGSGAAAGEAGGDPAGWRPAPAGLVAPDRESASSRLALVAFLLLGLPLPWRRRARVERFLRRA